MIEQEILEIIRDPTDNGERINAIADEFRCGRDVNDIIGLLDSEDPELVGLGAWILGELSLELYDFKPFVSRLRKIVAHEEASVRFSAFSALFPTLDPQEPATRVLLQSLRADPNEGVRRSAEAAAIRLSLT